MALSGYVRARRRKATLGIRQSRLMGQVAHWEQPIVCGLRDLGIRLLPDRLTRFGLRPLYAAPAAEDRTEASSR